MRVFRRGKRSFKTCISLESIILPSTITEIGSSAFYDCDSMKEVVLNEGLTTIGNNAFRECTSLESINFPSTLIKIGMESFNHCIKLRGVVLNKEIKKIGHLAFAHCKSLERINLKCTDSDTVLSGYVFAHCTRLRDLDLHCTQLYKHDKPMENKTFHGCLLERINFVTMSARLETIIILELRTRLMKSVVKWNEMVMSCLYPIRLNSNQFKEALVRLWP